MPHFQYTVFLFALAALPLLLLLYFFVLRWKKRTISKIGDARLVKELIKNYSPKKFALKFLLVVMAFSAGVMALANLRSSRGSEKVNRNGIDVMIALDVSKSMLAQDIKPSRLERAKQVMGKLIDKLNNDRIGIVVFAGRAYLQMPLTGDHGAAKMYLNAASTDVVPTQGTVIGDALKMCAASFSTKEKKYKSIILISDGEDHDEAAIKVAGQLANDGVSVNTVGIGSPEGTTLLDPVTNEIKKDNDGNTVISRLNEEALKNIAENGGGIYQLFTNTDEVINTLEAQLNSMDQRTVTEDALVNYKSYYQWFLIAALLILLVESFISENVKPASLNKRQIPKALALSFLVCIFSFNSFAQKDNALIKKGNESYNKQDFEKAANQYLKVIEKSPAHEVAQFNLGNALYKSNKPDEAVTAFDNAISQSKNKDKKAQEYYNKGVVQQNNKKLPECIESYKNALKLNPSDEDARQNLQKALLQQKEQQKKQEQDKKKNKPKEDEKQKEKQKPKDEEKKNDEPKPQPSKLSKQDAEEKLKALLQQEKNLQDKLKKVNAAAANKPEKDW